MDPFLAWLGLIFVGYVFWWWNEIWYVLPVMIRAKYSTDSSATKLPPGNMGFPFLGEMLTFHWFYKYLRRPDEFINSKRRKYGDGGGMFRTHLFGSPTIIVYTPALNKFVLGSEDTFMQEWPSVEILGTSSIAAIHGKEHARIRNFVITAINRAEALSRVAVLVQPRLVTVLKAWAEMGQFKAKFEARKLSFEHIAKLFIGAEPGPFILSLDKLYEGLLPGVRAYPINFPGFAYHRALQSRKKLEAIFWKELDKKKNDHNKVEANYDLMDGLMHTENAEGDRLSDKEVVDNIVSLVVGGYMTTSLVSTWAIYLLAKNPKVLTKLREENMALKKGSPGDFITTNDISNLKYTNKVVDEVIRVANVSAFVFRRVVQDVEYKGYKIPKGWSVIAFLRYIHACPENYEDPMYFNPERWNELPKAGTSQMFGSGPRRCPGNTLAKIQLALLLHHLSIGYKWELVNPNADIIYISHPTPIDGVEVRFSKL